MSNYRITAKDVSAAVAILNEEMGMNTAPWTRVGNGLQANIGTVYAENAYGGWQLVQMMNAEGGIRQLTYGYIPAREIYKVTMGMVRGLEAWRLARELVRESREDAMLACADADPATGVEYGTMS
jgi:hypothetical protein